MILQTFDKGKMFTSSFNFGSYCVIFNCLNKESDT